MAASEEAYGPGHPATFTTQPQPVTRRAQLSGIAFGEGTDHGFTIVLPHPKFDHTHE